MSLHADLLGDPVARIRHSPHYLMLVAETSGPGRRIVGLIRRTVKSVASAKSRPGAPALAKVGYILGLRVAASHRRMGVALQLVRQLEKWFELMSAEYAYMATDRSNEASLLHSHRLKAPRRATAVRLGARDAERLYRSRFVAHVEFFPADIGHVLDNALSRGTFLAIVEWGGDVNRFLASPPESWAVASAWDCGGVFRLVVSGASRLRRGAAAASRALDRVAKWLRVPSVPNLFRPFAGSGGRDAALAAEAVFASIVSMARGRAAAVAVEVEAMDTEDVWCMKRLGGGHADGWDWARSASAARSIFVDPREV
ncbi:unnamed protein product [Miscanthus lutarioriparius]|uniref:N-acetyltransferase domain-containing protein n=1 Tax=Miscanthus lutarioriparius TaxID=422564 RepID=A0A811R0B6_9POAL|nr:unnamed protein product [Miscanthus lutarioriparius]